MKRFFLHSWLVCVLPLAALSGCESTTLGKSCGGIAGDGCSLGEFCSYPPKAQCGAGDQTGVCLYLPTVCTEEYAPVCGCNGKTYGNECEANRAGVSVAKTGECESAADAGQSDAATQSDASTAVDAGQADASQQTDASRPDSSTGDAGARQHCGGWFSGTPCPKDHYCDYSETQGQCGIADGSGYCMPVPKICTLEYAPVCGCDGKTYSNVCAANSAGVSVNTKGECGSPQKTNCSPLDIRCKRAAPICPEGQVPSVEGTCYGPCVPVEQCSCSAPEQCPENGNKYTCWNHVQHCGPYVF